MTFQDGSRLYASVTHANGVAGALSRRRLLIGGDGRAAVWLVVLAVAVAGACGTRPRRPAPTTLATVERAAALERALGEMDALRKGFDTPFDRVEERGRTLLRDYSSADEQAQIYFQLAHIEAQSGFQHPDKTIGYVKQAMALPLEREKRILLYQYWGNALESAHEAAEGEALRTARRQIVEPYLRGLNEAVAYVKEIRGTPLPKPPPERQDLPGADNRALAFPQLVRAERERLLERIADLQHGFREQTAYLYSRAPRDRNEIRKVAEELISETRAIRRLMARVDARVREEDGKAPRGGGGARRVPASSPATKQAAPRRRKPATTVRASGPALIRERIDAQIEQLRRESTAESVKQLWQVEMFYWPGYRFDGAGGIALPLAADVGSHSVDQILSNRRFLKVFDELSRMPPAEAAEMINNQVRQSLPVYRSLLARDIATLKRNRAALPPGTPSTAGLSLQVSNNPDGTPTLNGVRLQCSPSHW